MRSTSRRVCLLRRPACLGTQRARALGINVLCHISCIRRGMRGTVALSLPLACFCLASRPCTAQGTRLAQIRECKATDVCSVSPCRTVLHWRQRTVRAAPLGTARQRKNIAARNERGAAYVPLMCSKACLGRRAGRARCHMAAAGHAQLESPCWRTHAPVQLVRAPKRSV